MNAWLEVSDDVLAEQAYLVARGVRALALVGHCEGSPFTVRVMEGRLARCAERGAIPFVCTRRDGVADYGFAAREWVADLVQWLSDADENAVPAKHRHRILGLLLGYAADAVAEFEEQRAGRLFRLPVSTSVLPESVAK